MEEISQLLDILSTLIVPIMGWLVSSISKLNKTLNNLDKSVALLNQTQAVTAEEVRLLFTKTDKLEEDMATVKARCETHHEKAGNCG